MIVTCYCMFANPFEVLMVMRTWIATTSLSVPFASLRRSYPVYSVCKYQQSRSSLDVIPRAVAVVAA